MATLLGILGVAATAFVGVSIVGDLFGGTAWDSIFTSIVEQFAVFCQALVRQFCAQFFVAFESFNSSIDDILSMFGLKNGSATLADLDWLNFSSDGSVLNVFAAFAGIGVFIAVLLLVINLFKAALAPVIEAKEKPTTLVARFVIAMILIIYSPSIITVISNATQSLGSYINSTACGYTDSTSGADRVFQKVTHYDEIDEMATADDGEDFESSEGAPTKYIFQRVSCAVIEIVCNIVLCVEFLKLLAELCMREMILFMEYLLFPAMAGTIVSRDTERIFHSYLQALFVQCILCGTSMIWYALFMGICSNISFKEWGIVAGMLLEIGYVQMARNFDNYLSRFGISSVGASSNLFDSIMCSINTVANTTGRIGKGISDIHNGRGLVGNGVQAAKNAVKGTAYDSKGNLDLSKMSPEAIANLGKQGLNSRTASQSTKQGQEALKQTLSNPKVFNALNKEQRAAVAAAAFGGKTGLENALGKAGVGTGVSELDFKLNSDGSLSVSGAKFGTKEDSNTGSFRLTPSGQVAPGNAVDVGGAQISAEKDSRPGDNPLNKMPGSDAEAVALTGHNLDDLKKNPALAASYMNQGAANKHMNDVLDKGAADQMAANGIHMAGDMTVGKDGLVHGSANTDAFGKQNVVMGSAGDLRKAGYSNIATFGEGDNAVSMAFSKAPQSGSLNATDGLQSDAQAQMLGYKDAKAFNNDAVGNKNLYQDSQSKADAINHAMSVGDGKNWNNLGMKAVVDDRGNLRAVAQNGNMDYSLNATGEKFDKTDDIQAFEAQDPHNMVDAAGNAYTASLMTDGTAHGGIGDYDAGYKCEATGQTFDLSKDEGRAEAEAFAAQGHNVVDEAGNAYTAALSSSQSLDADNFAYSTGSTRDEMRQGFAGGYNTEENADYTDKIVGASINENGTQTVYNAAGSCEGARMPNKATSTSSYTDYLYDSAHSSGITNEKTASQTFGENCTSDNGGRSWKTAGGAEYVRMYTAPTTGYSSSSSNVNPVTGVDDKGRPYTYVAVQKNKGFERNGAKNEKRSIRRGKREEDILQQPPITPHD